MFPRSMPTHWPKNSMRSDSASEVRRSRAAQSLAAAPSSANWRSPKPRAFSRWLVEEMEERLPGFDQHLKLHVTGCPNSCGQHWIADVGIEGKKIKVNGEHGRCLLLLRGRRARSASVDGASRRISLRRDRSARCARALARHDISLSGKLAKICAAFLPVTATRNCASFWRAKSVPAVARDLPISQNLAQLAGGIGD